GHRHGSNGFFTTEITEHTENGKLFDRRLIPWPDAENLSVLDIPHRGTDTENSFKPFSVLSVCSVVSFSLVLPVSSHGGRLVTHAGRYRSGNAQVSSRDVLDGVRSDVDLAD